MSPLAPVLLVLALSRADAADVLFDGARLPAWLPPEEVRPDPAPAPIAVRREVTASPIEAITPEGVGAARILVRWRIEVPRAGAAVEWVLAGPELLLESSTANGGAVTADARGTVFTGVLEGPTVVELVGRVPGDLHRGVAVDLMPAGSGTVTVPTTIVVSDAVALAPGRYAGAGARVTLAPAPERGTERPTLVLGEAAVGITVGEAEIRVGARIRFRVADGEIDRVAFSVPGAGVDLVVTGPQIASWTRSGDRVEAVLLRPERSLVALEASWSAPAPQGETATFSVPDVRPEGVFRTESTLQIARDGTIDVLPETPGWQPVAPSVLPDWGRGLVQGTPTAAFTGRGGTGTLTLFRFTPADGPATLVDVAQYTLATTHEGRVLMRAHYAVRNDRGAALRIAPPAGLSPIGVRVGGETATISRDGEVWLVPLAKSVETVEGLLSFPVEITFLGEVGSWEQREERRLDLPTVDVEVAVTRVTVHLPPKYRNRLKAGQEGVVEAFTEGSGITYGFAVGDTRAAQADAIFQSAVSAWMGNEFEQAKELLDELGSLGADNEDMKRLESNLQVVLGDDDVSKDGGVATTPSSGEDLLVRRVKEQARARASEEILLQEEAEQKAEEAYASGDYEEAEENYRQAIEIGTKLGKLSNREDETQNQANVELQTKLDKAVSTKKSKESAGISGKSQNTNEYVFDSIDVSGMLEKAQDSGEDAYPLFEATVADPVESIGYGSAEQGGRAAAESAAQRAAAEAAALAAMQAASNAAEERITRSAEEDRSGWYGEATEGEVAGAEGGVVGGVLGGVAGGQLAPEIDALYDGPIKQKPGPTDTESTSRGPILTQDFLNKVPPGRDHQSAVSLSSGVTGAETVEEPSPEQSKNERFKPKVVTRAPPPPPADPVRVSESLPGVGGKQKSPKREAPPEAEKAPDEISVMGGGDLLAAPVVTAASLSVVIPTTGQPVHYQHLLLPADAAWSIPVRAKKTRRTP